MSHTAHGMLVFVTILIMQQVTVDILQCLQNTEAWESEKTLDDMEQYFWDINESRTKMISLVKARKEVDVLSICWHVTVYVY